MPPTRGRECRTYIKAIDLRGTESEVLLPLELNIPSDTVSEFAGIIKETSELGKHSVTEMSSYGC